MHVITKGTLFREQYQVEEKLGEGGMAWVYRARHTRLGHEVAIKILFPHFASDLSIRQRFMAEAQIQSQIRHPHIAQVFDMIEEQGTFGFVMEWCNDGDLREWMREEKQAPNPEQWRTLFFPVVEAMAFAHEEGFVHRDLKPSNILIDRRKNRLCPKVSDFGIAKILGVTGRTRTGSLMGTLSYMSPEQVEDSKQSDHRSDVYSLGVMLYELATGRLPYAETGPSVVLQIFRDPPAPPTEAPKTLQPVILKCLEKDPTNRYADCHALLAALQDALAERHTKRWTRAAYPASLWVQPTASSIDELPLQPLQGALEVTVPPASFAQQVAPDSFVSANIPAAFDETEEAAVADLIASSSLASGELAFASSTIHLGPRQTEKSMELDSPPTGNISRESHTPKQRSPWVVRSLILSVLFLLGVSLAALWELDPLHWRQPKGLMAGFTKDAGVSAATPDTRPRPGTIFAKTITPPDQMPAPPRGVLLTPPVGVRPVSVKLRVAAIRPTSRRMGAVVRRPAFVTRRSALSVRRLPAVPKRRPNPQRAPGQRVAIGPIFPVSRRPSRRPPRGPRCPFKGAALCAKWKTCHHSQRDAGHACNEIARHYGFHKKARRDHKQASRFFRRACQQGLMKSCSQLGYNYAHAKGLRRDYAMAHKYYQKACDGGYMVGCSNRAILLELGRGVDADAHHANRLYQKACNGKHARGCLYYGFNLSKGRGVSKDKALALTYFQRSCQYGYGLACWWAGNAFIRGLGVQANEHRANEFFRKSCEHRFGWGCRELGISYEQGRRLPIDITHANRYYLRADQYLRKACRKKSGVACYRAGLAYAEGRGVAHNCEVANRYYRKACRLGYRRGCHATCLGHQTIPKRRGSTFLDGDP